MAEDSSQQPFPKPMKSFDLPKPEPLIGEENVTPEQLQAAGQAQETESRRQKGEPPPVPSSEQPPPVPQSQTKPDEAIEDTGSKSRERLSRQGAARQSKNLNQGDRWDSLRGGKGARKSGIDGPIQGGLGNFANKVSGAAKKSFNGDKKTKDQKNGPGGITGQMGGAGGNSPSSISKEIANTTVATVMDMDILIMLPIAIMFDLCGIVALVLSLFGVGLALQEVVDVSATIIIGFWIIVRAFLQGVTQKILSYIENKASSIGKNQGQQQGPPAQSSGGGLAQAGGKIAKKGITVSMEIIWWIVLSILKLIPILGDLIPSYTILVIRQFNLIKKAQGK